MATESPIRIMETSDKWPSSKTSASFGQPSANMTAEDLGLLLKGKFKGDGNNVMPNRCESAPPSMGGSFAAIQNLMTQQSSTFHSNIGHHKSSLGVCDQQNQQQASSAYFSYNSSDGSMNQRISSPHRSWENEPLVLRLSSLGSDWKVKSHDDYGTNSLQPNLPTHKEESEDDGSPHVIGNQKQQKSSVGLMQVGIPCTQSSANDPSCLVSYRSLDESVDHNSDKSQVSESDHQTASVSTSSYANNTCGTSVKPPLYIRQLPAFDINLDHNRNISDLDVAHVEAGIKAIDIYTTSNSESSSIKNRQGSQNSMPQSQVCQQQSSTLQAQGSKTELTSTGANYAFSSMPQVLHGPSSFSATDGQSILQSSGYTPSLYATAAALMTSPASFYPNLQLPGYFHPQFVPGGYAVNPSVHLPYQAGCPPYGAVPQAFQAATTPTSGVSGGGSTMHATDPHLNRFYGQFGFPIQPSFTDPLHIQYFQQPFRDTLNFSSGPIDGSAGYPGSALELSKGTEVITPGSVGRNILNHPRRGIVTSHYRMGSPTNVCPPMQFPASPRPVLPRTPMAGTSSGGKVDMRFSSVANRNTGVYSGWQGQGLENSSLCSLLEELKSGKGRRFELADIIGHIVEFSSDQHGSRFIQQKLENCSPEEKEAVFKEILPYAPKLMTDVFGNYVIQKFFDYGTTDQREDLASQIRGQVLPLSLQMYGCRVIQKALEVIQLEQKIDLVQELDGQIMRCVRDQNGNHVIQKCIESIPTDKIHFVISSFRGQVAQLSTHPYGCRVIQRVLEHCTDQQQSQIIVDEILDSVCALAQDQYGNYVTQHVLERGKPHERCQIIRKLSGRIVQLSQHKFASNVIEKCLEYGDPTSRELLIEEIIGQSDGNDNLLVMMKDQYANYVVQKILHMCSDIQRETILSRIKDHVNALKKYTYGKHIVARFEQLYGEAT